MVCFKVVASELVGGAFIVLHSGHHTLFYDSGGYGSQHGLGSYMSAWRELSNVFVRGGGGVAADSLVLI